MRVSPRQLTLLLTAFGFCSLMFAIVPAVTGRFDPLVGYIAVLAIYWVGFCVPVSWVFRRGSIQVSTRLGMPKKWIPAVAIAVPVVVFIVSNTMSAFDSRWDLLALSAICALINGPLEEIAWRRTFRANSDGRLSYELLGLGLFTLWHVPLYFCRGVSFDYGAVGLIGGALLLGVVWTFMTRAANSVGWPMVSHTLVNLAAFPTFFAMNFSG